MAWLRDGGVADLRRGGLFGRIERRGVLRCPRLRGGGVQFLGGGGLLARWALVVLDICEVEPSDLRRVMFRSFDFGEFKGGV